MNREDKLRVIHNRVGIAGSFLFFYAVQLFFSTYFNLYLTDIGYDTAQIGTLSSSALLLSLLLQPVLGFLSDRRQHVTTIPLFLLILMALLSLGFIYVRHTISLFIITCLFYICYTPMTPLLDNIALISGDDIGNRFGGIRIWGTIGYCIAALSAGVILKDDYSVFFIVLCVLNLLSFAFLAMIMRRKGRQRKKDQIKAHINGTFLSRNRFLFALLVAFISYQLTSGNFHSYYPIYFKDIGGSNSQVGVMMFISALSEIPLWLIVDSFIRFLGIAGMVSLAFVAAAVRWFMLYITDNVMLSILLNILHGISFVILDYCLITELNRCTSENSKARAQSIVNTLVVIFARVIGGFVSGYLASFWGIKNMMLFNFLVIVFGFLSFFFIGGRSLREEKGKNIEIKKGVIS